MRPLARRLGTATAALAVSCTGLAAAVVAPAQAATCSPLPHPAATVYRTGGTDRVDTAVQTSKVTFPGAHSARSVVLARSDDYADALAGVPLAARRGGPLLLTPTARLDARTAAEIRRVLRSGGSVYLLGGTRALSASVQRSVAATGATVHRISGSDRYSTAAGIASSVAAVNAPSRVFVATGLSFADALSAAATAGNRDGVVVLSEGSRLPAATASYLSAHRGTAIVAVGGPAAKAVAGRSNVTSVVGSDRYDTSARLAGRYATYSPDCSSAAGVSLASGTSFPDALAGGVYAARNGQALLLTRPTALPPQVRGYLKAGQSATLFDWARVFGGRSAISTTVTADLVSLLDAPVKTTGGGGGTLTGPGPNPDGSWTPQACSVAPDPSTGTGCLTPRTYSLYLQLHARGWALTCYDAHAWNPNSDHPKGKACDAIPGRIGVLPTAAQKARADALAAELQATAKLTGVNYIIWYGRIWSVGRAKEGWRPYDGGGVYDPASITGGHYDHVHISVF